MVLLFTEWIVRGMLLCLFTVVVLVLLRRAAAAYRHLVCSLALCGLLLLPLMQEVLPPLPVLAPASQPVVVAVPEPIPPAPFPVPRKGETEDPSVPSLPQRAGGVKPGGYGWVPPGGLDLWPLAWALGTALLLLRLTVALVRLRTLARQSPRVTFLETEVLVSDNVATPLTWGVRRPVILLPAALLSGDPAVAESALRHEKAHIARRDWLWHLLAEVACALCWFQPSAWWLRRQLRAESERACDDRVLLSGISGPDYAAHLLEILKVGRASALAPGMAASGSMEARVKHILDPKKPRRAPGGRLALTAALGLVLLPLASLKVAAKPSAPLAPKLTFLTPSALLAQAKATLVAPKPLSPMPLSEPTLAQPNVALAMPQPPAPTKIPLNNVVWGEAVDGLEPGLLLLSSEAAPQNSKVLYQTLLRNKSNKTISFFVRMLRDNGPDLPSFGVKQAEGAGELPPLDPLYEASLAPGEALLVPSAHEAQTLLIGEDGSKDRPHVRKIVPGKHLLSQPITVYRSLEKSQLTRLLGSAVPELKKISPDGTLRTVRSSRAAGEKALPGAQTLEAARMLTVTPALPGAPGPTLPLDKVIWGEAVDGLQAGFLLTSSSRVPLNSTLTYQTLVRNSSNKPISFYTRLLQYDSYEVPHVDGKPALGAKRSYPYDPHYHVTLAPGESVIVPAQNGKENLDIHIGEGGSESQPRVTLVAPGHLKITQPIRLWRSLEKVALGELMGIYTLTKVSPKGRLQTEGADRAVGMGAGTGRLEGGETLEAYIYLEVGTLNASAERSAASAVWGKVDRGLQCGLRMLTNQRTFKTGDTLEAELLWRNASDKKAHWVHPRQLDIVPLIRDARGKEWLIDMGARFMLLPSSTDYEPGAVYSLGVLKVTLVPEGTPSPKSNAEPAHITLPPGAYFFSGSGGVSRQGDPCPRSGEVAFTVEPDIELSLRLPKGVTTFSKLSEARFEVVLRNLGKPTSVSWITPANFGFYGPHLFTKDGEPIPYVHTVAGPYMGQSRDIGSGETIVLGTIRIPREVQEEWDALPQGPYLASGSPPPSPYEARFSLGITVSGKGEQTLTARLPFAVQRKK